FGGTPCISDLCLLPDPDLDQSLRIWQTDHLDQPPTVLKGIFTDPVEPLAFSPDGRYLASGGVYQIAAKNALLWDVHNLEAPPVVLRQITPGCESLAFSPDGRWLASTGYGMGHNQIALWDTRNPSADPIALPDALIDALTDVTWLPDGQTVVTGGSDGQVRFWKTTDPKAMPTVLRDKATPMPNLPYEPYYRGTSTLSIAVSRDGGLLAEATLLAGATLEP